MAENETLLDSSVWYLELDYFFLFLITQILVAVGIASGQSL